MTPGESLRLYGLRRQSEAAAALWLRRSRGGSGNQEINMLSKAIILLSGLCLGPILAAEGPQNSNPYAPPASASNHAALVETDTLAALAADLEKGDARTRMNAVRNLGASRDPESQRILVERFKRLPQAEPASDSNQTEKTEVLRQILPKLQPSERTPLLLNTFREEISALKAAESVGSATYYPRDLLYLTIASLEQAGFSEEVLQELGRLASDHAVPRSVRGELLAVFLRHDLEKGGIRTPEEKVRSVLNTIAVRPMAPIPWDIYRDQNKRIAYSKTEASQNRQKEMGKWLNSDEAVRTAAGERLLHFYGLTAVEQIVAVLEQPSMARDRRDYLALLATDILRKQFAGNPTPSAKVVALVEPLTKYVEGMEDPGAFSRRAYAAGNLNVFFAKTGLPRRVGIPSVGERSAPSSNRR